MRSGRVGSAKPKPEGGVGEGELELAAVFAEEEGKILTAKEAEVR